ncbi:adenylate/guanylate cyclase domain-containing protein [Solirubrobacter taibaiensis]|nr:adenylate/guanylate cyclase domain-containing protein [Solirubrobacter taibaiensis]
MTAPSPLRRILLLLVAALIAVGMGALFQAAGLMSAVERGSVNTRFDVRGAQDPPADVMVVDIDTRTAGEEDWPINRNHFAKAITELSQAGAGVIVLDVPITEESADPDADNALFEAVATAEPPVVMTTGEADKGETLIFGGGEGLKESGALPASSVLRIDTDDAVRRMGATEDGLRTVSYVAAEAKLGRAIKPPAEEPWIAYPGPPGTVSHLSLADVENGKFKPETVRGKVALIGVNGEYAHTIGDTHETPAGPEMAGPEIRAASIVTALDGFPLRDAPAWAVWVAIVALALIPPLFALRWGPFVALVAGFVAAALYLVFAQFAFNGDRIIAIIPPLAAVVTSMIATASLVHGDRPAWLDRFLDFVSPSRGGNTRTRRLRALLLLIAAFAAVAIPLFLEVSGALKRVDLATIDTRYSIRGDQEPPPDVVLVGFDDITFEQLNEQWPFPRGFHAKAITALKAAGARSIAYDVQFTEPSGETEEDIKNDNALIEAVRKAGNVVLSTTEVGPGGTTRVLGGGEALKASRGTAASTSYATDADGRIRRMMFDQDGLESFPLAAVRVAQGGKAVALPDGDSAYIEFPGGLGTVRKIPFSEVYKGTFPKSAVRGKIVVVGSTATSLQDFHRTATSGDSTMAGAEIQADAIQTVLNDFPLRPVPWWVNALIVIVLGALTPLLALRFKMGLAIAAGLFALAAFVIAAQILFENGALLAGIYPIVAAVAGLLATGAIHGLTVAFEREQARDAFARFVPEAVVDQVLADAEGVRLGGVRGEATVMFSDLRGFTSFSETLEPERVIESLNMYLTQMSEAILDHGGTLVAYMGDGIMAVFGAPLKQEDHADRALEAARDMLGRMDGFNGWLREQGLHDGFKMGIGLNSGPVMSGNVGSERRLEYTALGDTTNTAARLEGMTKGTPHQLYISDTTRQALTRPVEDIVEVGEAEVRGRKAKVKLWSLRDGDEFNPAPPDPQRVEA